MLERLIRRLFPEYRIQEERRHTVLDYLKGEFRLGAICYETERQYRNLFAKYKQVRPAYPPEMATGLRELRTTARDLLRRRANLGTVPPGAGRSFLRWHEFYLAHDEAIAAEQALAEAYAEGLTPDTDLRDRLFKHEKGARKRAEREQWTLCDRLGLAVDEFRQLVADADSAADRENS